MIRQFWRWGITLPLCLLAVVFFGGCKCHPVISITAPVSMTNTVVMPTNSISVHQDLTNTVVLSPTNTTYIINSNASPITITNFISITITNAGIAGGTHAPENPDIHVSPLRWLWDFINSHWEWFAGLIASLWGAIKVAKGDIPQKILPQKTQSFLVFILFGVFIIILFDLVFSILFYSNSPQLEILLQSSEEWKNWAEIGAVIIGGLWTVWLFFYSRRADDPSLDGDITVESVDLKNGLVAVAVRAVWNNRSKFPLEMDTSQCNVLVFKIDPSTPPGPWHYKKHSPLYKYDFLGLLVLEQGAESVLRTHFILEKGCVYMFRWQIKSTESFNWLFLKKQSAYWARGIFWDSGKKDPEIKSLQPDKPNGDGERGP